MKNFTRAIIERYSWRWLWILPCLAWSTLAEAQIEPPTDPYSLVLIPADLDDAQKTLAIRDLDDDGILQKKEWATLEWSDSAAEVDLNRDGNLTHLEIAIHFASQRDKFSVEQIDRTVATRAIRKHDANQNGQIDAAEITSAWPEEPTEIDVNGDGVLTLTELTNAFAFRRVVRREIGIIGVDQGWAIKIRNRFDRDRDGGLNSQEWHDAPLPRKPEDFDEDDDKRLSLMEIATLFAKYRQELGLTAKDQLSARETISRFDRNFDGVASELEMKPFEETLGDAIKQLKELDKDRDGDVSLMEIEKALSERREELGYSDRNSAEANRLILRHDKNRDKRISENELKERSREGYLGRETLPQIDRNGDRTIDHDELARYLARQGS